MRFIPVNRGPERGLGHVRMSWDTPIHREVGIASCGNGGGQPCPSLGHVKHIGKLFENEPGIPVTATGSIVGPVGGFGWMLELNLGAPRHIKFDHIEVLHDTPLLLSIAYPPGTTFTLTAEANSECHENNGEFACMEVFQAVDSVDQVRFGPGNQYHVDSSGVITFRLVQSPPSFVGRRDWFFPMRNDTELIYVDHFERNGMTLPRFAPGPGYTLKADCVGTGPYCEGVLLQRNPNVCPSGYRQAAYDRCCSKRRPRKCVFANGSITEITATHHLMNRTSEELLAGALLVGAFCLIFCRWGRSKFDYAYMKMQ